MPFDLVLLPLLAGYYLLHRLYLTKFRAQTLSGYRIIFESALVGVGLLVGARLLTFFIAPAVTARFPLAVSALGMWKARFAPFDYAGTAALSLLLSIAAVHLVNRLGDKGTAAYRAYRKYGGELLVLLLRAQVGSDEGPFPVLITLKNRKVYSGFVLGAPTPAQEKQYVKLLPSASGYREEKTLTIHWTTLYGPVYERVKAGEFGTGWDPEDFTVVIPLEDIGTATTFVPEVPTDAFFIGNPLETVGEDD